MTLNPSDELVKMRQIEWGDIVLPVTKLSNRISPRFAVNSYIEGDADELVKMGSESRQFAAELIFDNSLKDMFPKTYRSFMLAVQAGVAKTLKHPIQGDILCFAKDYSDDLNAEHRSGVRATCTFVETLSSPQSSLIDLAPTKAIAFDDKEIMNAAQRPEIDDCPSLLDTLNQINKLQNQISGFGDKLGKQVNSIQNQFGNAVNKAISTFKSAGTAQAALAAGMLRKKLDLYAPQKSKLKMFTTSADISAYALAKNLSTTTGKLVQLNPNIAGLPVVKAHTIIFYE